MLRQLRGVRHGCDLGFSRFRGCRIAKKLLWIAQASVTLRVVRQKCCVSVRIMSFSMATDATAGSLSVRRCCVWRYALSRGNRLRCRWWEWRLAEKQCLSSKISFKTVAWVEQSFDIRLFKDCFVSSFFSRWVRGPTRPRLLCSEPGGRARRFLRRKWCRVRTSCLSGLSANWSLLTCECCVVVKSPKKDNQYDEVRRNTAAMRTFLA